MPLRLIGTIGDVRFRLLWPSPPLVEKVWGESHTGMKVNLAANMSVLNLTRAEGGEFASEHVWNFTRAKGGETCKAMF